VRESKSKLLREERERERERIPPLQGSIAAGRRPSGTTDSAGPASKSLRITPSHLAHPFLHVLHVQNMQNVALRDPRPGHLARDVRVIPSHSESCFWLLTPPSPPGERFTRVKRLTRAKRNGQVQLCV
jgi:hypothetical protein